MNLGGAPLSFWEFPSNWGVSHHFGGVPCHWRWGKKSDHFEMPIILGSSSGILGRFPILLIWGRWGLSLEAFSEFWECPCYFMTGPHPSGKASM